MRYLLLAALIITNCVEAAEFTDGTSQQALNLRLKFASLELPLRQNQFNRPLVLESQESPASLKGDIYAIVDYPLSKLSLEMSKPDHWCDVLLMHNNTKYCHANESASGTMLSLYIGKKTPEELDDVAHIDFNYAVASSTREYFQIRLNAEKGPFGTSDYLILLEGIKVSNSKTFLHLSYSYATSFSGRLAMLAYLNTIGSGKVGFTAIDKPDSAQPAYISGVRGLVERNTMRYYLALDSFLAATNAPTKKEQLEKRLRTWFAAVEQYPRQLHEMDREEYLVMKRAENVRQQNAR